MQQVRSKIEPGLPINAEAGVPAEVPAAGLGPAGAVVTALETYLESSSVQAAKLGHFLAAAAAPAAAIGAPTTTSDGGSAHVVAQSASAAAVAGMQVQGAAAAAVASLQRSGSGHLARSSTSRRKADLVLIAGERVQAELQLQNPFALVGELTVRGKMMSAPGQANHLAQRWRYGDETAIALLSQWLTYADIFEVKHGFICCYDAFVMVERRPRPAGHQCVERADLLHPGVAAQPHPMQAGLHHFEPATDQQAASSSPQQQPAADDQQVANSSLQQQTAAAALQPTGSEQWDCLVLSKPLLAANKWPDITVLMGLGWLHEVSIAEMHAPRPPPLSTASSGLTGMGTGGQGGSGAGNGSGSGNGRRDDGAGDDTENDRPGKRACLAPIWSSDSVGGQGCSQPSDVVVDADQLHDVAKGSQQQQQHVLPKQKRQQQQLDLPAQLKRPALASTRVGSPAERADEMAQLQCMLQRRQVQGTKTPQGRLQLQQTVTQSRARRLCGQQHQPQQQQGPMGQHCWPQQQNKPCTTAVVGSMTLQLSTSASEASSRRQEASSNSSSSQQHLD